MQTSSWSLFDYTGFARNRRQDSLSTDQTSKRTELKSLHATPQEQLPPAYVSLKELFNERHRYEVFPAFQRKQCWLTRHNQALIDTILLGDPIPPLEGYQEFNTQGETVWGIVDGHQRISAILDFMDGKFRTWSLGQKRRSEPNSDAPVEPGKLFEELSVIAKNYFLDYRLQINKIRNKSQAQMGTRFLRIQNHMPLSAAERLNIYASKANAAARRIEKHPFWDDLYYGVTKREQTFQSSLHLLALEMTPKITFDLQSWIYIHGLAAGNRDNMITDSIVDAVFTRLDVVSHVYAGTNFTIRAAIVPMYQSVMFLEQAGYVIQPKDKGRLTKWLNGIIAESNRATGVPSYGRPVQRLLREGAQKTFWDRHLPAVMKLFGIDASVVRKAVG